MIEDICLSIILIFLKRVFTDNRFLVAQKKTLQSYAIFLHVSFFDELKIYK